jgi:hypothetical protein
MPLCFLINERHKYGLSDIAAAKKVTILATSGDLSPSHF